MMKLKTLLVAVLLGLGFASAAVGQQVVLPCVKIGTSCAPVTAANPLPVTTSGGGGPTSTNVTQVGGVAVPTSPSALPVAGDTADSTADGGNPVKMGALFLTSTPTYTNGQRSTLFTDNKGNLRVTLTSGGTGATIANPADGQNTQASLFVYAFNGLNNGTTWDRWRSGGTLGSASVSGGVASGAADSGNPVKIGGVFNSALPVLAAGQRGDAQLDVSGRQIVSGAGAGLASGQVTAGTTATQIVAKRDGRLSVKITNLGTVDAFCGPSGVTTTTGDLLVGTKGAAVTIPTTGAVFCVVGTGTQALSFMEVF